MTVLTKKRFPCLLWYEEVSHPAWMLWQKIILPGKDFRFQRCGNSIIHFLTFITVTTNPEEDAFPPPVGPYLLFVIFQEVIKGQSPFYSWFTLPQRGKRKVEELSLSSFPKFSRKSTSFVIPEVLYWESKCFKYCGPLAETFRGDDLPLSSFPRFFIGNPCFCFFLFGTIGASPPII